MDWKVLAGAMTLTLAASVAGAQTDSTAAAKTAKTAPAPAAVRKAAPMTAAAGGEVVVLETAQGTIAIHLREDAAPLTCANFKKLVKSAFYDGTYFHRVIPGFMIQGGDPNTKNADPGDDGMGGPGYTVPAEIKLKHVRGAVATARTGDQVNPKRDSSGSQFFIDVRDQPFLDAGGYTVFGEVLAGMDVVDKIVNLANDPATLKGPMGANPQQKALIKKAWMRPAEAAGKPKPEAAPSK